MYIILTYSIFEYMTLELFFKLIIIKIIYIYIYIYIISCICVGLGTQDIL